MLPLHHAVDPPRLATGLTVAELAEILGGRTRAIAAARVIYGGAAAPSLPERVPGIAARSWEALRGRAAMPSWRIAARSSSADGTVKTAIELGDGALVETVLIPAARRSTVCVSSQAGCTRDCSFCATASLGFTRNLDAAEIVLQLLLARDAAPDGAPARNVVFMGMGEPMDNLDQVLRTVEILTQSPAPRLGAERVTVSTSGILPGMRRFLAESRAHLALSLNATTDESRARIMPQTRRWPIAALLAVLRDDARRTGRRHFLEYVLIDGLNDSDDDARRLVDLARDLPCRVNLIPHNRIPGSELAPSPPGRVARFRAIVAAGGLRCLVRAPRGPEIDAACGQLVARSGGDQIGTERATRRS